MSEMTTTNEGISRRKILIGGACMAAGGDNGRTGQVGKNFSIFPSEQRRAYHEHNHD